MMKIALLLFVLLVPSPPGPFSLNGRGGVASGGVYSMAGNVAGFRLAGVEPDGDPLDQVVLKTAIAGAPGVPRMHLVINAYMENFKPDTTPILPDLLHPNQTAQNLGGFIQGKSLLTDDAGNILYVGSFLAEAFLDNTNHMVAALDGTGAAHGGSGSFKGTFTLYKDGSLHGRLSGKIALPQPARRQLAAHAGTHMRKIEDIISAVTVKPHAMMGRATRSSSVPLHTGYGATSSSSGRSISPLTIVAGAGAVLSFLLAGFLWWWQRRAGQKTAGSKRIRDTEA